MAPPTPTTAIIFDYRTQVLDNCEFFVGREDIVSVITVKDAVGSYKAYAVRSNTETREALLSSEPFDTVQRAIESLHTKSSEAAHHYITTNGFGIPPDLKKAELCSDGDDDATSEVTRRSSSSTAAASEEEWNSSDDEAIMSGHAARNRHVSHKTSSQSSDRKDRKSTTVNKTRRSRSRSRSRSSVRTESDDEEPPTPGSLRYFGSMGPSPAAYRPPPPPPGWRGPQPPIQAIRNVPGMPHYQQSVPHPYPHHPRPQPRPNFAATAPRYAQVLGPAPHQPIPTPPTTTTHTSNANATPTSSGGGGGGGGGSPSSAVAAPSTSSPPFASPHPLPPSQRLYDVRLTIRWLHHGEQRIIENLRPSLRALQDAALRYVRTHPHSFAGSLSLSPEGRQATSPGAGVGVGVVGADCLRSCVRQAFFGPEAYDMSTYRCDDLSRLFAALSSGGIPRFEIDVDFIGGGVGFGVEVGVGASGNVVGR